MFNNHSLFTIFLMGDYDEINALIKRNFSRVPSPARFVEGKMSFFPDSLIADLGSLIGEIDGLVARETRESFNRELLDDYAVKFASLCSDEPFELVSGVVEYARIIRKKPSNVRVGNSFNWVFGRPSPSNSLYNPPDTIIGVNHSVVSELFFPQVPVQLRAGYRVIALVDTSVPLPEVIDFNPLFFNCDGLSDCFVNRKLSEREVALKLWCVNSSCSYE